MLELCDCLWHYSEETVIVVDKQPGLEEFGMTFAK